MMGRKDLPEKDGASEGIRTLDTHVGNVMLYQAELRSRPKARRNYGKYPGMQALFLAGNHRLSVQKFRLGYPLLISAAQRQKQLRRARRRMPQCNSIGFVP